MEGTEPVLELAERASVSGGRNNRDRPLDLALAVFRFTLLDPYDRESCRADRLEHGIVAGAIECEGRFQIHARFGEQTERSQDAASGLPQAGHGASRGANRPWRREGPVEQRSIGAEGSSHRKQWLEC